VYAEAEASLSIFFLKNMFIAYAEAEASLPISKKKHVYM
jgi:hypothetical protein